MQLTLSLSCLHHLIEIFLSSLQLPPALPLLVASLQLPPALPPALVRRILPWLLPGVETHPLSRLCHWLFHSSMWQPLRPIRYHGQAAHAVLFVQTVGAGWRSIKLTTLHVRCFCSGGGRRRGTADASNHSTMEAITRLRCVSPAAQNGGNSFRVALHHLLSGEPRRTLGVGTDPLRRLGPERTDGRQIEAFAAAILTPDSRL